jgi:hypothetical protein
MNNMCGDCNWPNPFPEDQWIEFPHKELAKIGKTQLIYKPSNYPGPIAMDVTIKKEKEDGTKRS